MKFVRRALAACVLGVAGLASAAPMVISTLPGPGTATEMDGAFASGSWFDLAVGFTLNGPGRIQHITAALSPQINSVGAFFFGLATNEMIGNAPTPDVFTPVPGSLWEVRVCTPEIDPLGLPTSSCDWEATLGAPSAAPLVQVASDDWVDLSVNIPIAAAGDYWLYTRFVTDQVFATWEKNADVQSTMVARRSGMQPDWAPDITYERVTSAQATPGFSVQFAPVPEPSAPALLGVALLAAWAARRRRGTQAG